MAFTAVTNPDRFIGAKGKTEFGSYTNTAGSTGGEIPISRNSTIFAMTLQSTNTGTTANPKVVSTFPIASQDTITIVTAANDTGIFIIHLV